MSSVAAILVEAQIEAREVEADGVTELRPLPVWCPLPRGEDDPKVTCVGWVAGRQSARAEGVVITTTWCRVETATPRELVSRPTEALRLDRLPADVGRLWPLSRLRSLHWLHEALSTTRRFRSSLDLGAINERRASVFAGVRWTGPNRPPPVFGRGWWLPGEAALRRETEVTLGALDDRFILLRAQGGVLDEKSLVADMEAAIGRRWVEQSLNEAAS
ncbi:MAG: hypothetical protein ACTHN3_13145 [Solirubrobacterales bacterium]